MSWTKHGYGSLGALELSCIILAFIVIAIGFMALTSEKKGLIVLFIILSFLSALFVIGVAIFCLIATKTRYWKDYLGCTGNYKGLLSVWNSVDTYLQVVDQYFCGKNCPCFFGPTLTKLYTANSTTAPYYHIWEKQEFNDDNIKRKNIDYCIDSIDPNSKDAKSEKEELYKKLKEKYLSRNAYFNHTFNVEKFHKYYKKIEKRFKCTGFCSITYFNDETNTNQKIVKYLFSDMSKEIPEHFGCIGAIMDWFRKTLIAYGIICCLLFLVLLILFIIGILLLLVIDEEEKEKSVEEKEEEIESKKSDEEEKVEEEKKEEIKEEEEKKEESKESEFNFSQNSFKPTDDQINENDIKFNPSILRP